MIKVDKGNANISGRMTIAELLAEYSVATDAVYRTLKECVPEMSEDDAKDTMRQAFDMGINEADNDDGHKAKVEVEKSYDGKTAMEMLLDILGMERPQ